MNTRKNRIKGALYGFAIGDAMGATTEFMNSKCIAKTYGKVTDIIGGGWLHLKPGQVTDDTQMSICVMDALMKTKGKADDFIVSCGDNFIDWYNSCPPDIGGRCRQSIAAGNYSRQLNQKYIEAMFVESNVQNALGNGSLMRALPCALYLRMDLNIAQGRLTHNNITCDSYIKVYHKIISSLIVFGDAEMPQISDLMEPTGCIINTLNNALYWSNKASVDDCIISAVNNGGDADTIAAITGSIAGARYGYKSIPKNLINQLDDDVCKKLDKFTEFCFKNLKKTID